MTIPFIDVAITNVFPAEALANETAFAQAIAEGQLSNTALATFGAAYEAAGGGTEVVDALNAYITTGDYNAFLQLLAGLKDHPEFFQAAFGFVQNQNPHQIRFAPRKAVVAKLAATLKNPPDGQPSHFWSSSSNTASKQRWHASYRQTGFSL